MIIILLAYLSVWITVSVWKYSKENPHIRYPREPFLVLPVFVFVACFGAIWFLDFAIQKGNVWVGSEYKRDDYSQRIHVPQDGKFVQSNLTSTYKGRANYENVFVYYETNGEYYIQRTIQPYNTVLKPSDKDYEYMTWQVIHYKPSNWWSPIIYSVTEETRKTLYIKPETIKKL